MKVVDWDSYPVMKASEVFWLGDVPAHWEITRIRNVARLLNGATPSSGVPAYWDGDILWITPNDLGALTNRSICASARRITRAGYEACGTLIAPAGSVAISTRAPIGYVAILGHPACVNQGCKLIVPAPLLTSGYLYYTLNVARSELESLGRGSTFIELSRETLFGFPLVLPPLSEQDAIVCYLDHAERRIRRYIRAKEKLIALLEEQKQAIIHQAVTGQIDVRTGKPYPAYKDSGTVWLGTVPENWGIRRSKRIFTPRKELARPSDIQLSATQAFGVIAQADYEKRVGRKIVKIFRHLEKRRHVEIDDFVISMRSFQGGLERAWVSGCVRSSYIVLQPATRLNVDYFGYLFKSTGYIAALQSTANFIRDGQDLNFKNFCGVNLPFPPIEEQRKIAQFLDGGTADIATTIESYRRETALLGEYRARLIADVVTGKLDVREAAAATPEKLDAPTDSMEVIDLENAIEMREEVAP